MPLEIRVAWQMDCSTLRPLHDSQRFKQRNMSQPESHEMASLRIFRITARYIPSEANTVADAISRLHDPAFFHALSAQLRGYSKQTTAVSLAFQNWRSLLSHDRCSPCSRANTPRRIERVPSRCLCAINFSYIQIVITSVPSLLSLPRLRPGSPNTFSGTSCSSRDLCSLAASIIISTLYVCCICSMGTLTPLKSLFPNTRKPSSWEA